MRPLFAFLAAVPLTAVLAQTAADPARTAILPPEQPWSGKSESLIVPKNDPWITPAERSDFRTTPSYDETIAWLRRLVAASPQLRLTSMGKSPEGRDLWMVIASKERRFTPAEVRRTNKPIVFAQAAIHAGEMDGKDAGLMLLRDMTVRGTRRDLLDMANFVFVPIFNVDGHERASAFSRINQRGPEVVGWRTNARNLNLNRDYAKADTPEMRMMIRALSDWDPDLYIDLHVTDGADYQYDITFGHAGPNGWSPSISRWLDQTLYPAFNRDLRAAGHIPGPLVFFVDDFDPAKGISLGPADPRFSTGYGDARHIPTVLVENHSLKPYRQRVLGTYILLESALRTMGRAASELRQATRADRSRRPAELPVDWIAPPAGHPTMEFLGIESRVVPSAVSGALTVEYSGKPVTMRIPVVLQTEVAKSVSRPAAYWIPPWAVDVLERLAAHGIPFERIATSREVDVEMYRFENPRIAGDVFEGHVRINAVARPEQRRERFPAGSVRVRTDQDLGDLAVILLEPDSPDSFFQWGLLPESLQRTEYVESYVMVPMAERMLEADPALAAEFRKKLAEDDEFRGSERARLDWFYQRTPFFDERWRLYPIARER